MAGLPRITVVTPSLNQGAYLEQTITSVLEQQYPNLEYMVLDGGSTDNSVEIIRKHEARLTYWVSERDAGQAAAIAHGFARSTGEVLAWLNSDDQYLPGTLATVGRHFAEHPDAGLVYGDYVLLFPDGRRKVKKKIAFDFEICLYSYLMIPQPSAFWRRSCYQATGGLDVSLRYAMDYDLFLRMGQLARVINLREPLSLFRVHPASKSVAEADRFSGDYLLARAKHLSHAEMNTARFRRRQRYLLAKAVWLFLWQRGVLVLGKEAGKA